MKVGDLVKYKRNRFDDAGWSFNIYDGPGPVGLIVDIKNTFSSGGGGAWPSAETHAIISWSSEKGNWITNEREEDLELINESR